MLFRSLVIPDEASPDDIIRQIETIASVAKRHKIISSDSKLEDLKDTLLQINVKKCRDFLEVLKQIAKNDINLKIPEDIQKEQDPEKLDEKLGEWIEKNKESLSSLEELNLKGKNLDFLPKSIGKLTNLKYLNIEGNNIIYLPDSIDQLKNLKKIHLDIDKIKYFSDFVVDLFFKIGRAHV